MTYDKVISAFEYWQQKGLVKIKNGKNISFEYTEPFPNAPFELYAEQEYNKTLQKLFGARILTPGEYNKIYDYTDTFKLPKEVVLLLLEYCINMKGKNISFSYIDKIALSWANEGVDTVNEACIRIKRFEAGTSDAGKVLKHIGIMDRLPTEDEIALYRKWTKDFGFSLDAVKTACALTTGSRSPSMKYLDTIIKSLYEKGLSTSSSIMLAMKESEKDTAKIKKILLTLGFNNLGVSPEHSIYYKKWSSYFSSEAILLAAKQAFLYSRKTFGYIDKILDSWKEKGLKNLNDIQAYLNEISVLNKKIENIFKLSGIKKHPAESDRKKYLKWTRDYCFAEDVISLACDISSVSENPYKYLDRLLTIWHEKGVKTYKEVALEAKKTSAAKPDRKNNAESLKYMQRNYTDEDLSSLVVDLRKRK